MYKKLNYSGICNKVKKFVYNCNRLTTMADNEVESGS